MSDITITQENIHHKQEYSNSSKPSIISVKGLTKSFNLSSGPIEVLHPMDFDIPEQSFAIIFGPSGSGKSTLINILSGLEPPTAGTVEVDGSDIYSLNPDERAHFRAQTLGIVHQEHYWIKSLNVLENVAMPLFLTGSGRESALSVAQDSLRKVGMIEYANYSTTLLSGGQQQRVSMARALVSSPKIILADEPTGNLDTKNGQLIIDLLRYFQKELQRTIILVTHNTEYLPLSTTQLFIRDGSVTLSRAGQKLPAEIKDALQAQISALTNMEKVG